MPDFAANLTIALPIFVKILIGAVLGALIGIEREAHGRPAGVRTHMLIVIGVVLICEVSKSFSGTSDPSRIAAQIVTGIGFIGAGTILRMGIEIRGLTSAASVWAASGVGMAVSVGGPFLIVAVLSTCLILVTLALVAQIEFRYSPRSHARELLVRFGDRSAVGGLIANLNKAQINVEAVRVVNQEPFEAALTVSGLHQMAVSTAAATEGVVESRWSN